MLAMGTRAAAFTAKVRSLNDYQLRLLHGIVPLPSGTDIANTLKYFSQTLMTVLKDVPHSPLELVKSPEKDSTRLGLFPSLEYKGLYRACTQLLEVAPLIQNGNEAFGTAILQCLGCLLPFLDVDMIDSLPYLVASALAVLPSTLHQEVINSLCFHILPFTITRRTECEESYASMSVTSVIMLVFQHSSSATHHCQLMECLMALKPGVVKDILCIIAYGTSSARASAAKLLFYYWPPFNQNIFEKKNVLPKYSSDWTPFVCQRDMCSNAGNAEAAKVCYDHCISITFSTDRPPPLYLCIECANEIHREHPNQLFYDILHPMQQASLVCENKHCRASDKNAVSVCFASECANFNGNHPIRFCQHCHSTRHNNRRGGDHLVHIALQQVWDMDAEIQLYLLESIVSLLKEAQPRDQQKQPEIHQKAGLGEDIAQMDNMSLEESQLLGKYGVWLLIGLCTPRENTSIEVIGRLLSILFHWFYVTAYLYAGQVLTEGTMEKLKTEYVCPWLNNMSKKYFKVFVSCLLPHPPEYARVGGHWDTLVSRTCHLKEGLHQLLCLVPYEIVSIEIWEHVMPRWLEAIVQDVPPKELHEFKRFLSKILDPVLSPLGFDPKKMYRFISVRFKKTTSKVQEQALHWLQMLTVLEIVVPMNLLFSIFNDAVKAMQSIIEGKDKTNHLFADEESRRSSISPVKEDDSEIISPLSEDEGHSLIKPKESEIDAELDLSCCILMLDILLKQIELQSTERHAGITTSLAQDVWFLLKSMLTAHWAGPHDCEKRECGHCEARVMWYQLAYELVILMNPKKTARPPDRKVEESSDDGQGRKGSPDSTKKPDPKADVVLAMPMPLMEVHSVGGVLVHMPHIMTATVETVAEQLDLAPVVATERIYPAVARQVTISDTDVATATAYVARAKIVGEDDQLLEDVEEDTEGFWQTSEGKFRIIIEELPAHLQLLYTLLNTLPRASVSELYQALQCIYILVLYGDAFTKAAKDHRGFFIWCQENLLIKSLWQNCCASQSHVCEKAVPILLHCITLPVGSDTFWKVIQEDFHSTDWKVRFEAVERVTVVARFMDETPLRNEPVLQAALANIFCYLISSMDDDDVQVSQRATLYLGTIHDSAMKSFISCLENQFDTVMVDRPVVLQTLYQLHNCLTDRKILSWDFFVNRFDALFLEAQINLEKAGDISSIRDLRNSHFSSEYFTRKLNRAHEALSRSESSESSIKTLTASFGPKWPYKRTMSAPASMVPHQENKQDKEKVYSRQYSAPILKRKTSRFGLGQFLGSCSLPIASSLPDGHIHSLVAGDDSGLATLTRVLNFEGSDHETTHLLIFLLMQFLARPEQAFPSTQEKQPDPQAIVLRHLYLLMGYSHQENTFYHSPQRLRCSPVFNAFLANLPQVLDQNYVMGRIITGPCMALLQYCPAGRTNNQSNMPTYSLWLLECHVRRNWLLSVLVILYKFYYTQPPDCNQISILIRIVLNTLSAQNHVCRRMPTSVFAGSAPSRSREMSQPSLGGDREDSSNTGDKLDSPPSSPSPLFTSDVRSKIHLPSKSSSAPMETHWEEPDGKTVNSSVDINGESMRGDLWKSDTTLRGSPQDSEETVERKMSLHERMKSSWFLGGDDDNSNSQDEKDASRKCGVKQGMMMMVASSIFASAQPVTAKAANGKSSGPPERRSSLACAVATAIKPVIETATKPVVATSKPSTTTTSVVTNQKDSPLTTTKQSSQSRETENKLPADSHQLPATTLPKEEQQTVVHRHVTAPWRIETGLTCSSDSANRGDFDNSSFGSPDSPLSKMEPIPMSSHLDGESVCSRESCNHSVSQLEMPPLERLLPIGPSHDVASLTERLHRSLTQNFSSNQSMTEEEPSSSRPDDQSSAPSYCASKQESLERPDNILSRSASPRKLTKQMALAESPPDEDPHITFRTDSIEKDKKSAHGNKDKGDDRMRKKNDRGGGKKRRKTGLFSIGSAPGTHNPRRPGSWCGSQQPLLDPQTQQACHAAFDLRQSQFRVGDECVVNRCAECGASREEYMDEELGLCIVILGTFIHREPSLAAPFLPEILNTVAKPSTESYTLSEGSKMSEGKSVGERGVADQIDGRREGSKGSVRFSQLSEKSELSKHEQDEEAQVQRKSEERQRTIEISEQSENSLVLKQTATKDKEEISSEMVEDGEGIKETIRFSEEAEGSESLKKELSENDDVTEEADKIRGHQRKMEPIKWNEHINEDEIKTIVSEINMEASPKAEDEESLKSEVGSVPKQKSRRSVFTVVEKFEEDELDLIKKFPPSMNIEGVKDIFLTHEMQNVAMCVVGMKVRADEPWTTVNKDHLIKALSMSKNKHASQIVQDMVENEEKKILIGYIPDFDPANQRGHWFHIAATSFGRKILESILLENSQKSFDNTLPMTAVVKTPGKWKSLGSEMEIESGQALDSRPLIEMEIHLPKNKLGHPIDFKDSGDVRCYTIGPPRTPFHGVPMNKIDIGVQAVPPVSSALAQTNPGLPVNAWSQYEYDIEKAQEVAGEQTAKELPSDYKFSQVEEMEKALNFNVNFNLYTNDYPRLVVKEEDSLMQSKNLHQPRESFSAVRYCRKKILAFVAWHPMWEDIIACAYATAVRSEVTTKSVVNMEIVDNDVFNQAPILIWSLHDALEPRLVLQCMRETNVLCWCPTLSNLLVSGSVSGQIILWDITDQLEAVESQEVLTKEQTRYRTSIRNLMNWSHTIESKKFIKATAASSLKDSHAGMVTGMCWVTPFFEINANGNYNRVPEGKTSMQCLTSGEDGYVFVWELSNIPEEVTLAAEEEKKKRAHLKINNFMAPKSRFYLLNQMLRPLFKIFIRPPAGKDNLCITSLIVDGSPVRYKKIATKASDSSHLSKSTKTSIAETQEFMPANASEIPGTHKSSDFSKGPEKTDKFSSIKNYKEVDNISLDAVTDIYEMENFKVAQGQIRYSYVPINEKVKPPSRLLSIGTNNGEIWTARWEGHDFDTGEAIMTETAVVEHYASGIHDGPITCIIANNVIGSLFLTVGGTVFALWSNTLKNAPLLWKTRPVRLVSASWSSDNPVLFRIGRADGSIELWNLLSRSDDPLLEQNLSGSPLTFIANRNPPTEIINSKVESLAVADHSNSLRILDVPMSGQISEDEYNKADNLIKNATKIVNDYNKWNSKYSEDNKDNLRLRREKEEQKAAKAQEEELARQKEADLQAKLEAQEAKRLARRTRATIKGFEEKQTDEGQEMLNFLLTKKELNKDDLKVKLEPLTEAAVAEKEKNQRRMEVIKQQNAIFEKTISILFPDVVEQVEETQSQFEAVYNDIKTKVYDYVQGFKIAEQELKNVVAKQPFRKQLDLKKTYLDRRQKIILMHSDKEAQSFSSVTSDWDGRKSSSLISAVSESKISYSALKESEESEFSGKNSLEPSMASLREISPQETSINLTEEA